MSNAITLKWSEMVSSDDEVDEVVSDEVEMEAKLVIAPKQDPVLPTPPTIQVVNPEPEVKTMRDVLFPGTKVKAPKPQPKSQERECPASSQAESKEFVHVFIPWVKPREMKQALFDLLWSDHSLNNSGMRLNLDEALKRYMKLIPGSVENRTKIKSDRKRKEAASIEKNGLAIHNAKLAHSKAKGAKASLTKNKS